MCNLISYILICRHKRAGPSWCVLNEWSCKRNAAFVSVTNSVCSSTVWNSGNSIRVNIVLIAAGKIAAAVVAHSLNVYAFVAGSRVAVVNPEEGTDFHLFTRLLENLHFVCIKENNFGRTKLVVILVAKIYVSKVFKRNTVGSVFLTNLEWSSAKLVAGSINTSRLSKSAWK